MPHSNSLLAIGAANLVQELFAHLRIVLQSCHNLLLRGCLLGVCWLLLLSFLASVLTTLPSGPYLQSSSFSFFTSALTLILVCAVQVY